MGNTVTTSERRDEKMGFTVFVKTLGGKTLSYEVESTDTVEILKCRIQEKEGVPPDLMRLICNGRELKDGHYLREYGIQHEFSIYLILKLRGGWTPEEDDGMGDKNTKNRSRENLSNF